MRGLRVGPPPPARPRARDRGVGAAGAVRAPRPGRGDPRRAGGRRALRRSPSRRRPARRHRGRPRSRPRALPRDGVGGVPARRAARRTTSCPTCSPCPGCAPGWAGGRAGGVGARLGWWCFETTTPLTEGTYEAARSAVDCALAATDAVLGGEPRRLRPVPAAGPPRDDVAVRRVLLLQQRGDRRRPRRVGDGRAGRRARRRLPPRQRHAADLLRARRRRVRVAARRPGAGLPVPHRVTPTRPAPGGGAAHDCNVPLAGRHRRRRLPRRARPGARRGRRVRPGRSSSCRSASTRTSATRCATSRSRPRASPAAARAVAALGRPLVVLQEGGYADDALGANVRAWLRGAASAIWARFVTGRDRLGVRDDLRPDGGATPP